MQFRWNRMNLISLRKHTSRYYLNLFFIFRIFDSDTDNMRYKLIAVCVIMINICGVTSQMIFTYYYLTVVGFLLPMFLLWSCLQRWWWNYLYTNHHMWSNYSDNLVKYVVLWSQIKSKFSRIPEQAYLYLLPHPGQKYTFKLYM